ncbi:MAG: carboxypeptidase-like regulatory domain-containing protein, partial [Bacteroidales bacterium]|nr:carboxypeptidase-like regulatory domain-containing protein [Bacteroidales bacterium]
MSIFTVSAEHSYSQFQKVLLKYKNVAIKTVLKGIEKQSDYSFFYSDEVDLDKKVTVSLESQDVEEVLEILLSGTDFKYKMIDNYITIYKSEQEEIRKAPLQQGFRITGSVSDNEGALMPGVNVLVRGTSLGTNTDANGEYMLMVPSDTCVLLFRFIGYQPQEATVGNRRIIAITLQESAAELEEVVVVAFGKQKKESVIGAISTINPSDLKVPSSNLTTALAGNMAGVIAYQRSGEPGQDNADFFVRGITTFGTNTNPLILIDGIELTSDDLSRLRPDDIESFSILKDATATALYGARGANGVILVTTKQGTEGPAKISFRFENSISAPTQNVEIADP